MPRVGPIKRRDLLRYLKQVGFEGPYSGGNHQFMLKGNLTLRIPNPHEGDISKNLLTRILKQAHINKEEWERL